MNKYMYISNSNFENLVQTYNPQQDFTNKGKLQNELGSFEACLKCELRTPKETINNTINNILIKKILLDKDISLNNYNLDTSNNSQFMNSLSQILNSIIKYTQLEHGDVASASKLSSYTNKAKLYSQNQVTYLNAPSGEYNKAFNNDLFFGDSITKGLSAFNILDDSEVYAKVGIGTAMVKEMVNSATKQNPERVFIMSGINDIGSYNKAQFAQHYTDLIDTIKAKYPHAKIYIQSILPVLGQATQNNPSLNNNKISEFNSVISQISKTEKVGFLNTSALVSSNPNLYASDGIHYKPSFYSTWLNFIQNNAK